MTIYFFLQREIISVQNTHEFELPEIYTVGRLLKEHDKVLAYTNSKYKKSHFQQSKINVDLYQIHASNILQQYLK